MSLSPRVAPRHSNHTLTFTDPDLTDTYRDQRSTSSRASSANNRHPRGDTPVSLRGTGGSRADGASTSGSSSRGAGSGSEGGSRGMPELSKLMAFLDGDASDEDNTRPLGDYVSPAPRPGSSHATRNGSRSSGRGPMSSTPPLPHLSHATVQHSPTVTLTSQLGDRTQSVTSPSIRAHSRSQIRANSRQSARPTPTLASAEPRRLDMEGEELPDSPSPLPGSMASMSLGLRRSNSALGGRISREDEKQETDRVRQEEEEVTVRYEGWADETSRSARGELEGSLPDSAERDDVSRLAEEVLNEFTSIVNPSHSSSPSRPGSRLRNIPSPPRSTSSTQQLPMEYAPHDVRSSSGRSSASAEGGAEASRGKKALGAWRAANGYAPSIPEPVPQPSHSTESLIAELQQARAYISRLQQELSDIRETVGQLQSHQGQSSKSPSPPRSTQLSGTPRGTLAVAQHLLALLPTSGALSSADLAALPLPAPTLDSVALALEFVREVDGVVHLSSAASLSSLNRDDGNGGAGLGDGAGQAKRRDEVVFRRDNLDGILRRMKGWERVVRAGEGAGRRGSR